MEDYKKILQERLKETLSNDTQEVVAKKLNTVQSNVSKWIKGTQVPTSDTLVEISKAYKVSIDWLLGLSDVKEVDGISLEKITYKDVMEMLDMFFKNQNIEVADVGPFIQSAQDKEKEEQPEIEEFDDEDELGEDKVEIDIHQFEPEYLKVKDRILAYFLRRRYATKEIGNDIYEMWREKYISQHRDFKINRDNKKLQDLADRIKNVSTYQDAEWVAFMEKVSRFSDDEYEQLMELLEKDGTIK